jgi:hypothetical protein
MAIDPTRKAPAAATLTDAESISLMKSHVAYTGKYDVDPAQTPDGIKITIHVVTQRQIRLSPGPIASSMRALTVRR